MLSNTHTHEHAHTHTTARAQYENTFLVLPEIIFMNIRILLFGADTEFFLGFVRYNRQ